MIIVLWSDSSIAVASMHLLYARSFLSDTFRSELQRIAVPPEGEVVVVLVLLVKKVVK